MKKVTISKKLAKLQKISWQELKTKYERNELKEKDNRDVSGLKKSILKNGFIVPFCIWEDGKYICDGAGRMLALEMLEYEGYEIPDLPYFSVEAKNLKEAKERTLAITSQYGIITPDSIGEFTIDMKDIDLSYINIDGYDLEEIDWTPPESKEIELDDMKGKTSHQHTCPKCSFKFSTK